MAKGTLLKGKAISRDQQRDAWGVLVETSNVRAVHVANGMMNLLRLSDDPPAWPDTPSPKDGQRVTAYVGDVKNALRTRIADFPMSREARALCVVGCKTGPLFFDAIRKDEPAFVEAGRAHVRSRLRFSTGDLPSREMQELLARALNADGKVMESGGADPTTTGLAFSGFSDPHTLSGMHAATFLGLLSRSTPGTEALAQLYALVRRVDDPHSRLVDMLGLGRDLSTTPDHVLPSSLKDAFPLPNGERWSQLAPLVGTMAHRLLSWRSDGPLKAQTLMSIVDLASLVLMLGILGRSSERLLLVLAHRQRHGGVHQAISRANESLQRACTGFSDELAYSPALQAKNLGAAGGWVYPSSSRGGARQYLRPGPRQLTTLVHCLIRRGETATWPEFCEQAERIGLALGGPNETKTERHLGIGGVSATIRVAGRVNREHLVALGLARQESDNVIVLDGGGGH